MLKFLKRTEIVVILTVVFCFLLFLPGFSTYFHQDDFIHLSVSQSISQVASSFNIFQKGEFPFYRPIPTQLYFFINETIFGLNPLGYHTVNFLIFSINIFLVYRLINLITKNKTISLLAISFFAVNSTHFAPLFSAAYVHELFYVLFGVLAVDNFLRWNMNHKWENYFTSVVFFVMALMSKETAVILPLIIILSLLFVSKKQKIVQTAKILLPYFAILGIYLSAHFLFYGIANSSSYTVVIGKQTLNILIWYFFWALSTPNIFIDFFGPGIKISPVFFQVAQTNGFIYIVLFPMLLFIGLILFTSLLKIKPSEEKANKLKLIVFGLIWFVGGMVPLIIFPLHKLATEQAFSLVGLSITLSTLVVAAKKYRIISTLFVVIYLIIAINSILLARRTHWIVISARQAHETVNFIKENYANLSDDDTLYFRNGEIKLAPYGSSRQIYQALGNGIGLKLVLGKPNLKLYFEDLGQKPDFSDKDIIQIDSSKLLGY